jgi:uncharacterized BrkB/YihY/UPF0761 family membrane protein
MTTATKPDRERKSWDFILTIFLLVVYLGWSLLCCFAGALVAFVSDSCGASSTCNTDLVSTAFIIGTFGPAALAVIVLVFTIVWMVRRHISFWIPIAGAVFAAGIVALAYLIASSGVTPIS